MAFNLNWTSISAGLAALLGASVAFLFLAMPGDLFEGLVASTGLPSVLGAAQPPLGLTARLAVAAAAGLGSAAVVFAALRALDRPKRSYAMAMAPVAEVPRVRRADAHPDAPTRKPIFAGAEFGEPVFPAQNDAKTVILDRPPLAEAPPADVPAAEASAAPEAATIDVLAERLPQAPAIQASLGELMQRLEKGIGGQEQAHRPAPPAPADQDRLKDVIAELRNMSRSGA